MPTFECVARDRKGAIQVLAIEAPDQATAARQAQAQGFEVVRVDLHGPPRRARVTQDLLEDPDAEDLSTAPDTADLNTAPDTADLNTAPDTEDLTTSPDTLDLREGPAAEPVIMDRSAPSPDPQRWPCDAILKQGRHGRVTLLEDREHSRLVVARCLPGLHHPPAFVTHDHPALQRVDRVLAGADCTWLLSPFAAGWPADMLKPHLLQIDQALVVRHIIQLLGAVNFLHDEGFEVLVDLRPSDVVITPQGAQIVDLGLYERMCGEAEHDTHLFTPPELMDGGEPTQRSNLWSIGAIAFWLLTAETMEETSRHELEEVIRLYRSNLPNAVLALVLDLLSEDPAKRPFSAREAAHRLGEFTAPENTPLPETIPPVTFESPTPWLKLMTLPAFGIPEETDTQVVRAAVVEEEKPAPPKPTGVFAVWHETVDEMAWRMRRRPLLWTLSTLAVILLSVWGAVSAHQTKAARQQAIAANPPLLHLMRGRLETTRGGTWQPVRRLFGGARFVTSAKVGITVLGFGQACTLRIQRHAEAQVRRGKQGRIIFTIESGRLWMQTDDTQVVILNLPGVIARVQPNTTAEINLARRPHAGTYIRCRTGRVVAWVNELESKPPPATARTLKPGVVPKQVRTSSQQRVDKRFVLQNDQALFKPQRSWKVGRTRKFRADDGWQQWNMKWTAPAEMPTPTPTPR